MEVENYLWCVANAMSVDYSMARAKAPATIASAGLFHPVSQFFPSIKQGTRDVIRLELSYSEAISSNRFRCQIRVAVGTAD